jgi:hypothetical protein
MTNVISSLNKSYFGFFFYNPNFTDVNETTDETGNIKRTA